MNKLIKNSKIEIIENAGHFPFLDQPFEFRKIIKKHFNLSD
jgi:pimeloyl-ACP methyl ester carboxylesterase